MKTINFLYILFLSCVLGLLSCKREEALPASKEFMSAQVDGKDFKASTFVIARAGKTTSINGTFGAASNPESIGLSIQRARVGTFVLGEHTEDFAVYNSISDEYISISGTLHITAISEEWIEGNFSFVAHSMASPAKHITISNGAFKIKFD